MITKSKTWIISIIFFAIIVIISTGILYFILDIYLPKESKKVLKFPRTLKDVRLIHEALTGHGNDTHIVICYVATYIFAQSFAVPGSVMLSILGGALWGSWYSLALVSFVSKCTSVGATVCYWLSYYLGQPIIQKYLSKRMERWNEQLNAHRKGLFSYIIFLRVAPLLPNWFINIASPHLGISVGVFFGATFIGVMPIAFIHVQAGETILRLSETDEFTFWTTQNFVTIFLVSVATLIPIVLKNRYKSQENNTSVEREHVC